MTIFLSKLLKIAQTANLPYAPAVEEVIAKHMTNFIRLAQEQWFQFGLVLISFPLLVFLFLKVLINRPNPTI
ncbi:MAG TPA: hypothetical protein DCE52_16405 [Rhodobacteraceae bacterium]|nr:hypothetical protein [Paracoccaceae bacterium]